MKFSPDENIGAAALAQRFALKGKLLVHSIFPTWQGEMPFGGRSAIFLRLGGCNRGGKTFGCLFCDTAFEVRDSKLMTIKEVAEAISALRTEATELLVVTGGEPLMQQDSLMKLFEFSNFLPHHIQIETNGDYDIKPEHIKTVEFLPFTVVCSPKAWDGILQPFKSLSLNPESINYYRFLISATDKEYMQVPEEILVHCRDNPGKTAPRTLYLSPMTVYYEDSTKEERNKGWGGTSINVEATIANYQHCIKVADDLLKRNHWVRLSSQSHLMYGIA
jgi:organic radical activating enzyme